MALRIGLIGPHLARHPGWVTTQGEILAGLLAQAGHPVLETSAIRQPIPRFFDMARSVARWRNRVDVVLMSVFSGRAFYFADLLGRWCHALSLPQIHVLHGGDLPLLFSAKPAWARRVLGRAHAIVAPSRYLLRSVDALGFDTGKRPSTAIIPNVLDLDDYDYQHRTRLGHPTRILWMRTFHPIYNPELAIDALAALRSRGIEAFLTMAGQEKGSLSACRQRSVDQRVSEWVSFPGFLGRSEKRRAFAEHDIFWNTNQIDNAPVTVLEALASGLPVVATAVGGVPDLLNQEGLPDSGILVPPDDAAALAEATAELIASPSRVDQLSARGRELAETSGWPAVHARWLDLFARLDLGSTG